MLLTDTLRRLDGRPWHTLWRRETVNVIFTCLVLDISWKFVHPFFHNITSKHGSSLFLISCTNFAENFVKSVHPFHRNAANRHRFHWRHRKNSTRGVKRDTPKVFRLFPLCRENLFTHFSRMLLTDKHTNWNGNRRLCTCQNSRGDRDVIADVISVIKHTHSFVMISWLARIALKMSSFHLDMNI